MRLEEIKTYTDIKYNPSELSEKYFFKPDMSNPVTLVETSPINQLAGLEFGPSGTITTAIDKISRLGDLRDVDQLINPTFSKKSPVQAVSDLTPVKKKYQNGGFSLFTNSNKKEEKIINSLVSKWEKELMKAKLNLCKKHYLISTSIPKTQEYLNLNNKSGGGFDSWEQYYSTLINYQQKVGEYKTVYNNLVQISNEFNLAYLQFFYHKLFIVNYVKFTLIKPNYRVYHNISRGSVSYYLSIVSNILDKFASPEITNGNSTYSYFYTYHYLNLKILNGFLEFLYKNWKVAPGDIELESNKNISRLYILNSSMPHSPSFTKGFFLFNLFKDILDDYKLTLSSPISVFLRINDREELPPSDRNKKEINFKKSEITREQLELSNIQECLARTTVLEQDKILQQFGNTGGIKFNEIFDPEGFKSNETLALYMGIPNYLSKSQSIMMITYGYSGVGKTFTLFGNKGTQSGVLQKALTSIQEMKAIYTRSYEIYGLALPYKSYWSGRDPSEYAHKIYTYRIKSIGGVIEAEHTQQDIKSGTQIKTYLDDIKADIDDTNLGTYTKIDTLEITSFSDFVEKVDLIRVAQGRIKKTVNNPVSSRSIMVYEFKVKLNDGKVVKFIVMDLPGKEDILNSYIKPTNDLHANYCIQLKSSLSKYNQTALRSAIYLNPILLAVFPDIAVQLNKFVSDKFSKSKSYINYPVTTFYDKKLNVTKTIGDLIKWIELSEDDVKSTLKTYLKLNPGLFDKYNDSHIKTPVDKRTDDFESLKKVFNYEFNKKSDPSTQEIEIKNNLKILLGISFRESDYQIDDKNNFKNCLLAGENLRYILENNLIEVLNEFYSMYLIEQNTGPESKTGPDCNSNKNISSIAFEGFYINENILGLVNTLNKRLYRDCGKQFKNPIPSMDNFFSSKMKEYEETLSEVNKKNADTIDETLKVNIKKHISNIYNIPIADIGNIRLSSKNQSIYNLEYSFDYNSKTFQISDPGNETRSQTYFLRGFLRYPLNLSNGTSSYYLLNNNTMLSNSTQTNYDTSTFIDKTIKSWFEESYDFNKTYSDEPPIATFMEAYFGKESDGKTDVINNFYLFYVVSNDDKTKCANQIKLITDSEIFIKTIKEWTPC